jgi:hypothetical protein
MPRFVSDSRPISATHPIIEFYRQEFVKHHRCLQQQRPYYSESAITDVEAALTKIINQLEQLSTQDNAPQLVSSLLKQFDVVTGLSAWSDRKSPTDPFAEQLRHDLWPSSGPASLRSTRTILSIARSAPRRSTARGRCAWRREGRRADGARLPIAFGSVAAW